MKLDLKQVARQPGATLPFSLDMDLSGVDWNGAAPFRSPIHVEGVVRNMAGALLLRSRLSSVLRLSCDRCGKEFSREKAVEFETLLSDELENGESDDIVLYGRDGLLDADELMREVWLLNMDTKNLCSEDCKGLCPGCGADLNAGPCKCRRQVDPRLAKLAQLLEQDDG